MSAALDYARESILTAPEDLELHALLSWALGEEPLPASEYRVIDVLVREWWQQQTDAAVLLKDLTLVDHRAGVRGTVACARWALERYWIDASDREPWIAVETAEAWLRGEATIAECKLVAHIARLDADDDARSWAAADAAYAASWAAFTVAGAAHAADDAAPSAYCVAKAAACAAARAAARTANSAASASVAALRELCDVIRAAVECPPAEVWLREVRS